MTIGRISKRFGELIVEAQGIESRRGYQRDPYTEQSRDHVDDHELLNWKVKAKNLLVSACGESSQHFKQFEESDTKSWATNLEVLRRLIAVFRAAQEDFDGGYLIEIHDLVRAEVFGSELEQASELLNSGYKAPAAVIAGVVLETAIRDICTRNQISHGKLDKMNADLAKAGVYNGIVQKRVTHLAAVRNSAAHGNESEFKTYDVKAMISEVEQFLASHLT